jgi:hypothetical protein
MFWPPLVVPLLFREITNRPLPKNRLGDLRLPSRVGSAAEGDSAVSQTVTCSIQSRVIAFCDIKIRER